MQAVKVYHGFGHTHNMIVFGHVFKKLPTPRKKYTNNVIYNIRQLFKLFFVVPIADQKLKLRTGNQVETTTTEKDGFFKFEWDSHEHLVAGWHDVEVTSVSTTGDTLATGPGRVFVPHSTQFGFISDIDDTIMVSHSGTIGRRLRELFFHNPRTRTTFSDVGIHYKMLAQAHTTADAPNPFFYVSSSEWNLYDYLHEFFHHHGLPEGTFLLNQVKRWYQLLKTGKTKHQGKLLRIVRIFEAFPKQVFVLLGDNSQADPLIYSELSRKYSQQIHAVYIRNIIPENEERTRQYLQILDQQKIHTCLFTHSMDAIAHSRQIGLIE